ncbi:MAG TPA: hypothetical protein VGJ96_07695 [Gemmatimonadaceae bacterium]|jgi:hypothetical protein
MFLPKPVAEFLARRLIGARLIATIRVVGSCVAGALFAAGTIRLAAWLLGASAVLGLIGRLLARSINPTQTDSGVPGTAMVHGTAMDSIADGFLFGGLTFFFAADAWHRYLPMVAVGLAGLLATLISTYAGARAEFVGVSMEEIGVLERPARLLLLALPQAFFGLAFDGLLLRFVFVLFAAAAIARSVRQLAHDYLAAQGLAPSSAHTVDYALLGPALFSPPDTTK